jgi:hypothetical protein
VTYSLTESMKIFCFAFYYFQFTFDVASTIFLKFIYELNKFFLLILLLYIYFIIFNFQSLILLSSQNLFQIQTVLIQLFIALKSENVFDSLIQVLIKMNFITSVLHLIFENPLVVKLNEIHVGVI